MNRTLTLLPKRLAEKFPWRSKRRPTDDAAIFRGLRTSLTLWYSGLLGAAFVIFCIVFYFGAQQLLFSPIQRDLSIEARARIRFGQTQSTLSSLCSTSSSTPALPQQSPDQNQNQPQPTSFDHRQGFGPVILGACFTTNGTLLSGYNASTLPAAFLAPTLAEQVAQQTSTSDIYNPGTYDIVDAGSTVGTLYRYAVAFQDPTNSTRTLILQVGESVQAQTTTLQTLLTLIITLGCLLLLGAGLGGLFLASRALEPAHRAFQRQQRFIADASHELRTPLTLMRADAEVLLLGRRNLSNEDADLLENIITETEHMATLVSSMLTLARLDSTEQHSEQEIIDLNEIAQGGIRRITAFANKVGITVTQEQSAESYIIGDSALLEQAVMIVLDNAVKYNQPGGSVFVSTTIREKQACITIRDTGIGISAEHLPYLGERFYRVDKARSRAAGGNGLGLSIARNIVAVHGGTLTLSSEPEQGTITTICLPLAHIPVRQNEAGMLQPPIKA